MGGRERPRGTRREERAREALIGWWEDAVAGAARPTNMACLVAKDLESDAADIRARGLEALEGEVAFVGARFDSGTYIYWVADPRPWGSAEAFFAVVRAGFPEARFFAVCEQGAREVGGPGDLAPFGTPG